ncbi:hypothetical protein T4B_9576 [Trichinella pseudospiralis]|uniref:Uncharacterized protein n=1 Tax=Trichinella pseudospiralis TaxID=6337 RepID=A0A0V1G7K8_TRIPS|nr:hypothetical protein T4B_9576 [Trichinella pseudospiralis]
MLRSPSLVIREYCVRVCVNDVNFRLWDCSEYDCA